MARFRTSEDLMKCLAQKTCGRGGNLTVCCVHFVRTLEKYPLASNRVLFIFLLSGPPIDRRNRNLRNRMGNQLDSI